MSVCVNVNVDVRGCSCIIMACIYACVVVGEYVF